MSYTEDLRRRYPARARDPLFLRAQLEAFAAVMAEPRGRSVAELKPMADAMTEIEEALGPRPAVDPAALLKRAKARAHELGVTT